MCVFSPGFDREPLNKHQNVILAQAGICLKGGKTMEINALETGLAVTQ